MKLFYFLDDDVDETKPKIDSISSGYPTEELMERFAEIVKGRTYLHRPNQSLNLYLTAALAVSFFMVIGLGFGHFKGKKNSIAICMVHFTVAYLVEDFQLDMQNRKW